MWARGMPAAMAAAIHKAVTDWREKPSGKRMPLAVRRSQSSAVRRLEISAGLVLPWPRGKM